MIKLQDPSLYIVRHYLNVISYWALVRVTALSATDRSVRTIMPPYLVFAFDPHASTKQI